MTIHELANHGCSEKVDIPFNAMPSAREFFKPHETDVLFSECGLVIAINRVSGRFAAQRRKSCVLGYVDVELTTEQVALLSSAGF